MSNLVNFTDQIFILYGGFDKDKEVLLNEIVIVVKDENKIKEDENKIKENENIILTEFNDETLKIGLTDVVKLRENEYIVNNLPIEYNKIEYDYEYFEEIKYEGLIEIDQDNDLNKNIFNTTDIIKLNKIDELTKDKIININTIIECENINNLNCIFNDVIYLIPNTQGLIHQHEVKNSLEVLTNYTELMIDDLELDF